MGFATSNAVPILIFAATLILVYQVQRQDQLHDLAQAVEDPNHFATGGRKSIETKSEVRVDQDANTLSRGASESAVTANTHSTEADAASASYVCHTEPHAEYHGSVVKWGDGHLQDTAEDCCAACKSVADGGCNVWVWCGEPEGCGNTGSKRPHKECWLKKAEVEDLLEHAVGKGHSGIQWTSGILYSQQQYDAYQQGLAAKAAKEQARLEALKAREDLPLVWMDVSIDGKAAGRMEFVLFTDISPLAAENMRRMCTGEVSLQHTLKGANFYRIIDQFIDQTGVNVESALGGVFKDDPEGLKLKHDRKGLLSVANGGPDTNTGHFSILMGPAPHLNTHYVVFGEMVSGWETAVAINKLSQGQHNNEILGSRSAVITDVGQIRRGRPVPDEVIKAGLVRS